MKSTKRPRGSRSPLKKILLLGLMGHSALAVAMTGGCNVEDTDETEEDAVEEDSEALDAAKTLYKCTTKCTGDDKSVEYSVCAQSSDEAEKDTDADKTACKDHGGFGSDQSCKNTGNKC